MLLICLEYYVNRLKLIDWFLYQSLYFLVKDRSSFYYMAQLCNITLLVLNNLNKGILTKSYETKFPSLNIIFIYLCPDIAEIFLCLVTSNASQNRLYFFQMSTCVSHLNIYGTWPLAFDVNFNLVVYIVMNVLHHSWIRPFDIEI